MSDVPPPGTTGPVADPRDPVGLCRTCAHRREVPSRTSTFWRCGLSATDPRFPRYPRLPVIRCAGFEPAGEAKRG